MPARAREDESWRRSTLITPHLEHPPQVKAIVDELYATLSERGRRGYEAMITAEYVQRGEQITYDPCGAGVLGTIAVPARGGRTPRLTHLVYGGCTAHEIRQDLVARGLGSLAITWVYPADTVLVDDSDPLSAG